MSEDSDGVVSVEMTVTTIVAISPNMSICICMLMLDEQNQDSIHMAIQAAWEDNHRSHMNM